MKLQHLIIAYHLKELGVKLLQISLAGFILASIPPPIIEKIAVGLLLVGASCQLIGNTWIWYQQQQLSRQQDSTLE